MRETIICTIRNYCNDKIEEDEMGRACTGEKRNVCKILNGKPEVKGPLRNPMHRWENKES
jgi:hypothetical protein